MENKLLKGNDIILSFHRGCKNVLFEAFGIREMENSRFFIAGWYLGGFLLAYSIRMVRSNFGIQSMVVFILSLLLIILLSISGLSRGHMKNKTDKGEMKNEE